MTFYLISMYEWLHDASFTLGLVSWNSVSVYYAICAKVMLTRLVACRFLGILVISVLFLTLFAGLRIIENEININKNVLLSLSCLMLPHIKKDF